MRICILGMGQMGHTFAARALEKSHQVTVWNRSRGRAEDLVARGAREAESARAAVAGADAVLVVLADDAAVVDVCMGPDGVLGALEPDAVLANVSTVAPDTARQMAHAGPESRVLDTPVMGSPLMISSGLGRFLIGGPIDAATAIGPVWEDLGAGYVHCGPAGSAATMKVISNLLLITGVAALAEGIATARGHGITDDLLRSLLADSLVVSPATKLRLDSVLDSEHPGWFSPALARKDLRLAIGLAEKAGIAARVGPAIDVLLTSLIDSGRRWPDFSAIIEALR